MCQITPMFALYTFGPSILGSFGLGEGNASNLGSALIGIVFVLGGGNALLIAVVIACFRATAGGVATSISRIGAAAGTYLLPISLDRLGIGTTMLIGAGITAVGWLVSFAWAEETRGRTLAETSAVPGSAPPAGADEGRRDSLRERGLGRF
ncbi:hypothetical protein [Streptomyces regalis]|nr:hypothetical protein [Streptomyces regalis]